LRATPEGRRFDDGLIALRALLDAPEGGVQRLCEAAEMTLEALKDRSGKATINTEWLESALAALRASPESVGGAGVSERPLSEVARLASDYGKQIDELMAERDALKADLAAARGEVERVTRIRDAALKLLHATDAVLSGRPEDSIGPDQRGALRYARDNLGLAFSHKDAPPRCNVCGDEVVDCCCSLNTKPTKATPPPATEAPISERARWIADAVLRCESAREVLGTATEKDEERVVGEWTRCMGRLLAAAERAAKGEGGA
jgi:hypothetical protein